MKTISKTIVKHIVVAATLMSFVILHTKRQNSIFIKSDVEALASCEITNKDGDVIFECVGEEGTCSAKYLKFELTCSGKEVAK